MVVFLGALKLYGKEERNFEKFWEVNRENYRATIQLVVTLVSESTRLKATRAVCIPVTLMRKGF